VELFTILDEFAFPFFVPSLVDYSGVAGIFSYSLSAFFWRTLGAGAFFLVPSSPPGELFFLESS